MRRTTILTTAILIGLVSVSVPATAFHGASWIGEGTATNVVTGETRTAVVDWSGKQIGTLGTAQVKIGGEAPIPVEAHEDTTNTEIDGCIETVDPYIMTGVSAPFELTGTMVNDLCSDCFCKTDSHYEGRFGAWELVIDAEGDKDTLEDD